MPVRTTLLAMLLLTHVALGGADDGLKHVLICHNGASDPSTEGRYRSKIYAGKIAEKAVAEDPVGGLAAWSIDDDGALDARVALSYQKMLTVPAFAAEEAPAPPPPVPKSYMAVDNVCAWPNLTVMPDGAIVATIYSLPSHGGGEGDAQCWAGTDQGKTWTLRGTPAKHEPGTCRMNLAAGLARNDDLVVLCSGWDKRDMSAPRHARILKPWICRSSDGGRTWQVSKDFSCEFHAHRELHQRRLRLPQQRGTGRWPYPDCLLLAAHPHPSALSHGSCILERRRRLRPRNYEIRDWRRQALTGTEQSLS